MDSLKDLLAKEIKRILVRPKNKKPYYRTIDTEHMRAIGKIGFARTSEKIADMIKDPNADPDDVVGLARWFARRIKSTTDTYRAQWWREFRKNMKEGQNNVAASRVASAFIEELVSARNK